MTACSSSSSTEPSTSDEVFDTSGNPVVSKFSGVYETYAGFGFDYAYIVITPDGVMSTYKYPSDINSTIHYCYVLMNDHRSYENLSGDTYRIDYFDSDTDSEIVTIQLESDNIIFSGNNDDGPYEVSYAKTELSISDVTPDCYAVNDISRQMIEGHVVGRSLIYATVYIDTNNNARLDKGEDWAITDSDGYFSKSKDGLSNYCAIDTTREKRNYCLSVDAITDNAILRAYQGYDSLTSDTFNSTMSTRIDEASSNQVISPITSILAELPSDTESNFTAAYNLTIATDARRDFFSAEEFDLNSIQAAIAIKAVDSIFTSSLNKSYTKINGSSLSIPNNTGTFVYQRMADIVGEGDRLSSSNLEQVFDRAEIIIRNLYNQEGETAEELIDTTSKQKAISGAIKVLELIDTIFADTGSNEVTIDNISAKMLNIELIVLKIIEGHSFTDIDSAIIEASSSDSILSTALAREINRYEHYPLDDLVSINYSEPHYLQILDETSREAIPEIPGSQLYVSTNDNDNNQLFSKAFFFFDSAEQSAESGTFTTCMRQIGSDGQEADFLSGGTWMTLGENYPLMLDLAEIFDLTLSNYLPPDDEPIIGIGFNRTKNLYTSAEGFIAEGSDLQVLRPSNSSECSVLMSR